MLTSLFLLLALASTFQETATAAQDESSEAQELPPLHVEGEPYRTPRAGEGFRTTVFGRDIRVPPMDRRSISAWSIGGAFTAPGPAGSEALPFGALYFWRRPDEDTYLRAVVTGFFNDITFAKSSPGAGPLELVGTFENLTVPFSRAEVLGGEVIEEEELIWGHVRGGFGFGLRETVSPGHPDNLFALSLLAEPGYLHFDDGSDTADDFVVPQDTFEMRAHLKLRYDALERNLLSLPHAGYVFGADLVQAWRSNWEDWGRSGVERDDRSERYRLLTGYAWGAGGVPGIESDRHRLVGSVHFGVGAGLDRFSAPRLGGGPDGEDFGSMSRPLLPGATINELFPDGYVVALGEYRFEAMFFTYLALRGSVAWLDRDRLGPLGFERKEDVLTSIGGRVTTGFLFETRLQIDYNYAFDVIRHGDPGGHEVVLEISGSF